MKPYLYVVLFPIIMLGVSAAADPEPLKYCKSLDVRIQVASTGVDRTVTITEVKSESETEKKGAKEYTYSCNITEKCKVQAEYKEDKKVKSTSGYTNKKDTPVQAPRTGKAKVICTIEDIETVRRPVRPEKEDDEPKDKEGEDS